jgi:hypothetical protein
MRDVPVATVGEQAVGHGRGDVHFLLAHPDPVRTVDVHFGVVSTPVSADSQA